MVTQFAAGFQQADGVAADGSRLFVADSGMNSILQVTIPGAVTTVFASAELDGGLFVAGIVATADNHLFAITGTGNATVVEFRSDSYQAKDSRAPPPSG